MNKIKYIIMLIISGGITGAWAESKAMCYQNQTKIYSCCMLVGDKTDSKATKFLAGLFGGIAHGSSIKLKEWKNNMWVRGNTCSSSTINLNSDLREELQAQSDCGTTSMVYEGYNEMDQSFKDREASYGERVPYPYYIEKVCSKATNNYSGSVKIIGGVIVSNRVTHVCTFPDPANASQPKFLLWSYDKEKLANNTMQITTSFDGDFGNINSRKETNDSLITVDNNGMVTNASWSIPNIQNGFTLGKDIFTLSKQPNNLWKIEVNINNEKNMEINGAKCVLENDYQAYVAPNLAKPLDTWFPYLVSY